jgi:serine/threonine protein kinase/tetratricopeptide (TPR) repeat protein
MDVRDQLQKTLGDAYTIERELGGGGMSRVFVATEASLGRRVVVKVVPGASGGSVSIDRFKREIQLAARLQHPHIVPLLTAGESDGLPYFTMPFVEGESLRVRLARGGELPVAEGMRILREVAAALANAHEKGIVHRDIKPDNVLLSGGAAMVTDFGVAKALSASADDAHGSMTSLGVALGTPAYMAPEQAAASPNIDARADIYAWGIMAYEMFAGRAPFSGRSPQAILAAQVSEAPEHVLKLRPSLPPPLAALIMRCLEKHAADRPQSAGEVIHTLDAITTPSGGNEPTSAVKFAPTVDRSTETMAVQISPIGIAVTVIALVAVGFWAFSRIRSDSAPTDEPRTLAVLPLTNTDTASEYLSLGVGDDIRAKLITGARNLRVTSASTSNTYRGRTVEPRTVGQALNVAYVVLGEMRRSRDRIRVTAELVNTADGSAVWSESFDVVEQQLSALPDSIAQAIGAVLSPVTAGGVKTPNAAAVDTRDQKAYDFFLRAKFLLDKRGEESMRRSITLFRESIALDSTFARAHAGLAVALMILPDYSDTAGDSVYALSQAAADRAIALDPALAEAYAARGFLGSYVGRWNEGRRDLERAVQINPQYGMAYKFLGQMLLYSGDLARAEAPLRRATELDPLLPITWHNLGEYYWSVRNDSAALAAYGRALELDPSFRLSAFDVTRVLATAGRAREGLNATSKFPESSLNSWDLGIRAYALAKAGQTEEAMRIGTQLTARARASPTAAIGATFFQIGLGDGDAAIDFAISAARRGTISYLPTPDFDALRTHRRYPELLRALGLHDQPIAQWKGRAPQ